MLFNLSFFHINQNCDDLKDVYRLRNAGDSSKRNFMHFGMFFDSRRYVFKRLRFLGSKELSQAVTLFFLALWHGLYTGYFVNFAFEFFIVIFEKQVQPERFYTSYSYLRVIVQAWLVSSTL